MNISKGQIILNQDFKRVQLLTLNKYYQLWLKIIAKYAILYVNYYEEETAWYHCTTDNKYRYNTRM